MVPVARVPKKDKAAAAAAVGDGYRSKKGKRHDRGVSDLDALNAESESDDGDADDVPKPAKRKYVKCVTMSALLSRLA